MMNSRLMLLPAVDVRAGQAMQSVPGQHGSRSLPLEAPLLVARRWVQQGAQWVHLVDLDAAFGTGNNREVLQEAIAGLECFIELAGGITDEESLQWALRSGAHRVVIAAAALADFAWVKKSVELYGSRIAVGLDVLGPVSATERPHSQDGFLQLPAGNDSSRLEQWRVHPRGVPVPINLSLQQVLPELLAVGCARVIVTDVSTDGQLTGPPLRLLRLLTEHTSLPLVASGGVSAVQDVQDLRALVGDGLEGCILGTALYSGSLNLPEAIRAAEQ